jgi:glucosamine 6-phosphate synthetase-like amidotransferase/phosphosugar isomerase protein
VKKYQLKNGEKADVDHFLLKAIAQNPPVVSLSVDEMKESIDQLLVINSKKKLGRIRLYILFNNCMITCFLVSLFIKPFSGKIIKYSFSIPSFYSF